MVDGPSSQNQKDLFYPALGGVPAAEDCGGSTYAKVPIKESKRPRKL
jgi:hypothetical protein